MDILEKIDLFLEKDMSIPHIYSIDFYLGSNDTNIYSSLNSHLSNIGNIIFDEITSNRYIRSNKSIQEIRNSIEKDWEDFNKSFKFILIDYTNKDVDFIGIEDKIFKDLLTNLIK